MPSRKARYSQPPPITKAKTRWEIRGPHLETGFIFFLYNFVYIIIQTTPILSKLSLPLIHYPN